MRHQYNCISKYRDYEPSLPVRRPRALTLPLPSPSTPSGPRFRKRAPRSTNSQLESILVRLPLEIRLLIYKAVLGDRRVHVAFRSGPERRELESVPWDDDFGGKRTGEWSWWNTVCTWDHCEDASCRNILEHDLCGHTKYWSFPEKHWPPRSTGGMQKLEFAILLTCRKMWVPLPYVQHQLDVDCRAGMELAVIQRVSTFFTEQQPSSSMTRSSSVSFQDLLSLNDFSK